MSIEISVATDLAAAGNFGSPTQLLILLAIVILLFGGKRLRSLGGDIGNAIKGFKSAMSTEPSQSPETLHPPVITPASELEKDRRSIGS